MTLHVPATGLPILMVTGLAKEMRLAEGPGLAAIASGGDTRRLRKLLADRSVPGCRAVLSFGIAGGLDPSLAAGDVVVATGVIADGQRWPAHPALAESFAAALMAGGVNVRRADIAGVDAPLLDARSKAKVRETTGAAAVDMESHVASEFAARHGLVFAALRIVCDPATRTMPPLVANALRPDGGIDHFAIFADLVRRPTQLANLSRLAGEARASFRALSRCRDLLGVGRGLPNLLELLGDVA
jgi:hopanoid-associated phosphorylase